MKRMARRRKKKPLAEAVGERIQALRESKDWSRTELARQTRLSLTNLALVEAGRVQARLSTLEVIAQTLRVSVHDLIDDEAPPPPKTEKQSAALRRLLGRIEARRDDQIYVRALEQVSKTLDQAIRNG